MPQSKLSVFVSLLFVFGSGVLVGAVGHRLYTVDVAAPDRAKAQAPPKKPEEFRKRYEDDIRAAAKLDDQQLVQLRQILDETRESFHQLRDKMNEESQVIQNRQLAKIRAMLRADQLPLYEKFHAAREAERRLHPPHPPDLRK